MAKSPDAFRTISEVADWLGIQAHVLRFWESKFAQVKPIKRAGGRRYYRPGDMMLLGGIKKLLHDDGLTIKGVQKILREDGVGHVSTLSQPIDEMAADSAADSGVVKSDGVDTDAGDKGATTAADGTVVPFGGRRGRAKRGTDVDQIDMELEPADAEPQDAASTAPEVAGPDEAAPDGAAPDGAEPDAAAADSEVVAADAGTVEPESQEPLAEEPDVAEPVAAEPETADPETTEPEAADPEAAEPQDAEPPFLPEFLTRPAQPATVETPVEPPADRSGPLSRIIRLRTLGAEQAREAAPLAEALRGWLDRTHASRML